MEPKDFELPIEGSLHHLFHHQTKQNKSEKQDTHLVIKKEKNKSKEKTTHSPTRKK